MGTDDQHIIPGKFRKVYWWTLWLVFTLLLVSRRNQLFTSNINDIDKAVFGVWVIIMFMPLISEISILGVGIKRHFDDLRNEVNEKFLDIRTEIQSVSVSNQFGPFLTIPPSSEENRDRFIQSASSYIQEGWSTASQFGDIQRLRNELDLPDEFNPDKNSQYLINVRYALEKEVRRIFENYTSSARVVPITQMLRVLGNNDVLDNNTRQTLIELYAITSQAVHGKDVPENQVDFVKDAIGLLYYLRKIR